VGGRASESTTTEHERVDSNWATLGPSGVDKTSDDSGAGDGATPPQTLDTLSRNTATRRLASSARRDTPL
jgi:hypothetical protein